MIKIKYEHGSEPYIITDDYGKGVLENIAIVADRKFGMMCNGVPHLEYDDYAPFSIVAKVINEKKIFQVYDYRTGEKYGSPYDEETFGKVIYTGSEYMATLVSEDLRKQLKVAIMEDVINSSTYDWMIKACH